MKKIKLLVKEEDCKMIQNIYRKNICDSMRFVSVKFQNDTGESRLFYGERIKDDNHKC